MISAFANPNQPPLMSAESQEAALPMDPQKKKVMMAMMGQQMSKMGNMFSPQPMTRQSSPLDLYGQSPMMPSMPPMAGPVSAPTAPQPDAMPAPMTPPVPQAPTTMKRFMPFASEPMYRTDV